jgi:hypothetical protein
LNIAEIQYDTPEKQSYVLKTLIKSAGYSEKAVGDIEKIDLIGKSYPPDLKERLIKSISKHIEIVTQMYCGNPSPELKQAMSENISTMQALSAKAAALK